MRFPAFLFFSLVAVLHADPAITTRVDRRAAFLETARKHHGLEIDRVCNTLRPTPDARGFKV